MEARAFSVVVIPALAIEIVCCSITSWILVRSYGHHETDTGKDMWQDHHHTDSSILSNSSMQHTPMSASTSAPPSRTISFVNGSRVTEAVKPTPELPRPENCDENPQRDKNGTSNKRCSTAHPIKEKKATNRWCILHEGRVQQCI
jgi:hypothetical protein